MLKAKKYEAANTNIANLGSELEKNIKLQAAQGEPEWQKAGKQAGLQVWRIENFKVKSVDPKLHGQFFSGDAYIVLYTYKTNDALSFNVHFWLGAYTSQDEAGTAAYKTVELDDFLSGKPVQYREVQQYESKQFLSYFPKGLIVLEGGVNTGFQHVEPEKYQPRLLMVTGSKHIRSYEVPLNADSLNSSDAFILDAGLHIYQWNGKSSTGREKNRAGQISRALDDNRAGKATVHVIAEGEASAEASAFWKLLGHDAPVEVKASAPAVTVAAYEKVLLQVSDSNAAAGDITVTEVAKGAAVKKSLLRSEDVFILDAGTSIFVWVGLNASSVERKQSLGVAQAYVKKADKPPYVSISRVLEGGENEEFKNYLEN